MLTINHAQQRLARDWQHLLVSGRDWSVSESTNALIDPVTQTGMLLPLPMTPEFRTTATGDYARLRKSDTDRAAHTGWIEIQRGFEGNYYLHSQGLADNHADRIVSTSSTYARNRGFYVSYFSYNYGADDYVQLECGWIAGTDQVELRVWSSGQVEVWLNNQFAGNHTLGGDRDGSEQSPDTTIPNREVKLLLIPCRRRSLLVLTNQGSGFEHVFEHLDPEDDDNTITPADAQFYVNIPLGQATFQFCPARFRTSGKLLTPVQSFAVPPPTGTTLTLTSFGDAPGYGTSASAAAARNAADSADFVPDDVETDYRVRVNLTSDGTCSRWVYGAQLTADGAADLTDYSPVTLDTYLTHWTLSVDSRARATLDTELHSLDTVETLVPNLRTSAFLPAYFERSGVTYLDGATDPPGWRESSAARLRRATLTIRDYSLILQRYLFRDAFALDGLLFEDAVTRLLEYAGWDATQVNIPPTGYYLPTQHSSSRNDFALVVQVGDSAWSWIERLHERYGADRLYGFRPTLSGVQFFSHVWDDLPTTPIVTLYETRAAAVLAGHGANEYERWYRSFTAEQIEAEANEVIVTGWDSTTRRPLQSIWRDAAAQDPTTLVGSRPANWTGFPVRFGWVDTSLASLPQVEAVRDYFVARLTQPRTTVRWESTLLTDEDGVPVWVGDCVELNAHGTYRVTGIRAQHRHDETALAEYEGELIQE